MTLKPTLGAALALLGAGAAPAAPSPTPTATPTAEAKAAADAKRPESGLKMAMSADEVIRIMGGKPAETRPMKVQSGKAEIWVYERQVGDRSEQIPFTSPIMTEVKGPDGVMRQEQTGENVEYRDVHHLTYDVVELLMFNDHFVTFKVTQRQDQKIYQ